jgi:response regulator RpfG family c-di-GMP phosphodiesterase
MKTSTNDSYSVLVVDDEDVMRDLTRRALDQHGFRCVVAQDGIAAENLLRRRRFDAIIVDLRMPRKHGHQLITEVLQDRLHPLVIVLTGVCEGRLVQDLLSRGVADVVLKPCNYDLLAAKLHAYLARGPVPAATQSSAGAVPISVQIDSTTHSLKTQLEHVSNSFQATIRELTAQKEVLEEELVRSVRVLESLMSLGANQGESHASRVEQFSLAIGEAAGMGRMDLQHVRVAALLHEIGQFGMPDAIRKSSPEELDAAQFEVYRRYPEIGAALISEIPGLAAVVDLIESHAENYDGSGFPKRRKGEAIPLGARILRLADGVDPLLQSCVAQDGYDAVQQYLRDQRGLAYDPELVPHAIQHVAALSRNELGDDVELIATASLRPGMALAEALYDDRGQFLARSGAVVTPAMVDLIRRLVPGCKIRVRAHPPATNPD